MTGLKKPEACATASTPPPSASSRPATSKAKATAPTASSSNPQTTPAAHHNDRKVGVSANSGLPGNMPQRTRAQVLVHKYSQTIDRGNLVDAGTHRSYYGLAEGAAISGI